jgi:hypothetical protein
LEVTALLILFSSATTWSTASCVPRRRSMGFRPAATACFTSHENAHRPPETGEESGLRSAALRQGVSMEGHATLELTIPSHIQEEDARKGSGVNCVPHSQVMRMWDACALRYPSPTRARALHPEHVPMNG